ncbi:MAG: AMP-binding protein, partial [Acidimicrobiales bacterium]
MFPGTHAELSPNKAAQIMASTGEVTTYAELDAGANRLAHLFTAAGLQPGDHVALCLENHPRFLEVAWGAHYAGLVYTACSSRLTPGELAYIVDDCGARVFITSARLADVAAAIVADTPAVELRLMLDGSDGDHQSYADAVAEHPPTPHRPDRVEGVDMLYSSGTTGRPKGVATPLPGTPLGTANALTLLCQVLLGLDDTSIYLTPAPLYHSAPLRFTMQAQRLGGTAVVMDH